MLVIFPEMLAAVLLCLFGVFYPFVGVLGLLVFNVGQPEQVFHILGTLHVEKIAGIVILASFLLKNKTPLRLSPIGGWLLAFYGAVLASIPLAIWIGHSVDFAMDFGKTIVLVFLIINVVNTRKRLHIFLLVYTVLLGYLAISGLANFYMGSAATHYIGDPGRLVGITSDSNAPDTLANSLAASLPLLGIFLAHGKWRWRLIFAVMCLASLYSMMLTGTRTALYILVVVALIYGLRTPRRVLGLIAVGIVFFGMWAALPDHIKSRYVSTLSSEGMQNDIDYQLRLMAWDGGFHMFLHNPLTGIGVADYNVANGTVYWPGPGHKRYFDAHSLVFKLLGELGLTGFIAFLGFVVVLIRTNFHVRRMLQQREAAFWLRAYPHAANYVILILLLVGYGSHDVYRSTWYILAGMTGAAALILGDERPSPALEVPAALQVAPPT